MYTLEKGLTIPPPIVYNIHNEKPLNEKSTFGTIPLQRAADGENAAAGGQREWTHEGRTKSVLRPVAPDGSISAVTRGFRNIAYGLRGQRITFAKLGGTAGAY